MNVSKAKLEGLFADELALLQPTPGDMRLLKESVPQIWKARKATVRDEISAAERTAKAIQEKLDRLDQAFLFDRPISIETYDRHAEKLREELTLARIDVTLASSKDSTWKASWPSQNVFYRAPLTSGSRRRSTSGSGSNNCSFRTESRSTEIAGTGPTAPAFGYLREIRAENEGLVDQSSASWNRLTAWLRQIEGLRRVA